MPVTTVTKDTGGRAMPSTWVFVNPDAALTEQDAQRVLADTDLNGPLVADLLSQFLAHERGGFHLYTMAADRTDNPMLKKKYEEFGGETEHHIGVLERLITTLGGEPGYVSPPARLTDAMNAKLVEAVVLNAGSADMAVMETAVLEAVMLAEAKDHANWETLAAIGEQLPDGPAREAVTTAVRDVLPDEAEHLTWAKETWQQMLVQQVKHPTVSKGVGFVERTVEKVKDKLG